MSEVHIPPDLKRKLEQEKTTLEASGEFKKITVMFVDMRGFSHMLRKHDAKRVLMLLDIYFRMLVTIVRQHGGIVDKFIGDGLMAIWGLPDARKDDVYNAIRAAVDIRIGMFRLIPELVSIGEVPLEIGIGIGTGTALSGFVGPPSRRDFTLVGNCINRAARLQSIASDNRIFIDGSTAAEVRSYSFILSSKKKPLNYLMYIERLFELEGLYEFNKEFETSRRHPRVIVAKVAGVTNLKTGRRKPVLVKSIGEGGFGIEIHDYKDFSLDVGDEAVLDSKNLKLIDMHDMKGYIVRKKELKGKGIFRVKTWDIGIKFVDLPEETRNRLLKVAAASLMVRDIVNFADVV